MKNYLIFSVSIGAGHDLAAQALANQLTSSYGANVDIIDTFQYINPVLDKVVRGSYMETLRFNPKAWGYLYQQAETSDHFVDLGTILSKLFSPKLDLLVREKNPAALISTHAFPCGMLSILKEKKNLELPLIAILTDFTIHPFWIHDRVNKYVLPSEQLKFPIMEYGVTEDQIWSFGLPIRPEFCQQTTPALAKGKLGFNENPVVLIMGGGLGLGSIKKLTERIANADINLQVITVAGKNKDLYNQLIELETKNPLKVYGFVENMAELLAAADVVVSKPGGLTTAEVLACGKPMMIVAPIPGQEERNTDFLLNNGVALKARNIYEVLPLLKQLLHTPQRIQRIKEAAQELGKPDAATSVAQAIEALTN